MPLTHPKSLERLSHVHPDIAKVVMAAYDEACKLGVPFTVAQGLRTIEEQEALYAQGRTTAGPIVTWTMNSRHLSGHAVDLAVIIGGKYITDPQAYDILADVMLRTAAQLQIPIVWGGTFRPNPDRPHFELNRAFYK